MQETLQDEQGQSFAAVTLAVRGDVKELLDAIARLNPAYGSYAHLVGDALGKGWRCCWRGLKRENKKNGQIARFLCSVIIPAAFVRI